MARIKCECGREQIVPDGKAKKCRKCGAMLSTVPAKTAKREKLSAEQLQERYPKLVSELTKAAVEATAKKLTEADDGTELTADDLKEFFPEAFAEAEQDPEAAGDIAATAVKSILENAGITLPPMIGTMPAASDELRDAFLKAIEDHTNAATVITVRAILEKADMPLPKDIGDLGGAFLEILEDRTKAATAKAVSDRNAVIGKMDAQEFTAAFPKVAKKVRKAAK